MQYFEAVQKGKARASKSQMRLFDAAGFAMLTLTTKKHDGSFVPVGEEDFAAIIRTVDGYVTIIADGEGYTKAQTKALEENEARAVLEKLRSSGVPDYAGDEVEIWTESYKTVR